MLEILKQHSVTKDGNDCLIKENLVILSVCDTYLVMHFKKYTGWGDDELNICNQKECKDRNEAEDYFEKIKNNEMEELTYEIFDIY